MQNAIFPASLVEFSGNAGAQGGQSEEEGNRLHGGWSRPLRPVITHQHLIDAYNKQTFSGLQEGEAM